MPTLQQYRNMLRINKLRLDDELEIQAEMQDAIGAEVARLNTRAIEAKDELARVEARLGDDVRDADPKTTVDQVKGRVQRHEDRRRAWSNYQQKRETHEEWQNLLEAWITKGYKIADLGGLYASDYFAVRTITRPDGDRSRELNVIDEESRSALRRASERSSSGSARESAQGAEDDSQPRSRRRSAL